ncbi:hypothetical protein PPL_06788 [Heterostelium album PN500]|uniref:Integrator complex subunit 14 n=1 Tax=Heterostelium pallidum (strain ATCC 26659 / Pp 5 / PN500) TaxID=670386 RepID=D3BFQ3_HETP5|nr:hypothetical protein PPL_06788 [Heterostelium album PN500]EFA79967.1 hypothetical protein PPL_06788 [Heterostelium album PN500]|eukprot:XP_020432087.1 hypothetical protein PPL_06788 [Heterostelium album PN500]
MPTILLLDVSMSMARSIYIGDQSNLNVAGSTTPRGVGEDDVSSEDDTDISTYKELMKNAIYYFLQLLEKNGPYMLDSIALIAYSSNVVATVSFTRDIQSIRQCLLDLTLCDTTNLPNALNEAVKLTIQKYGASGHLFEILVFTDACTTFDINKQQDNNSNKITTTNNNNNNNKQNDNQQQSLLHQLNIPFVNHLHFISICTNQQHKHPLKTATNQIFNNSIKSTLYIIKQYSTNNIRLSLTDTINSIVNNHCIVLISYNNIIIYINFTIYLPILDSFYKGLLTFGHLTSPITLYPSIHTLFKYVSDRFDATSGLNAFPSVLTILGFLPNRNAMELPTVSRHVIVPLVSDTLPPLCSVLHSTLRNLKSTAIVVINESVEWYGMLTASLESDTSVLVLSTFMPGSYNTDPLIAKSMTGSSLTIDLSQLDVGPLTVPPTTTPPPTATAATTNSNNANASPTNTSPPQQQQQQQQQSPIPSYNVNQKDSTNSIIISFIKPDALQSDFTKVQRICRSSPLKFENLVVECERVRQIALIYQHPQLLQQMSLVIREELGINYIESIPILKDLLTRLEIGSYKDEIKLYRESSPVQQPLQQQQTQQTMSSPPAPPLPTTSKKKSAGMSVNSLLNF